MVVGRSLDGRRTVGGWSLDCPKDGRWSVRRMVVGLSEGWPLDGRKTVFGRSLDSQTILSSKFLGNKTLSSTVGTSVRTFFERMNVFILFDIGRYFIGTN